MSTRMSMTRATHGRVRGEVPARDASLASAIPGPTLFLLLLLLFLGAVTVAVGTGLVVSAILGLCCGAAPSTVSTAETLVGVTTGLLLGVAAPRLAPVAGRRGPASGPWGLATGTLLVVGVAQLGRGAGLVASAICARDCLSVSAAYAVRVLVQGAVGGSILAWILCFALPAWRGARPGSSRVPR